MQDASTKDIKRTQAISFDLISEVFSFQVHKDYDPDAVLFIRYL